MSKLHFRPAPSASLRVSQANRTKRRDGSLKPVTKCQPLGAQATTPPIHFERSKMLGSCVMELELTSSQMRCTRESNHVVTSKV